MQKTSFNENWTFRKIGGNIVKSIFLPHDAMQEEERRADAPSGSGCAYYEGGIYEYTKKFQVPEQWAGQEVQLEFEGIYQTSEIFLNGVRIGGCKYGYRDFFVRLENLKYGEENELKVIADNSQVPNTRWYSGAGIYRPVWLWSGSKNHIQPQGIRIRTISCEPARIQVQTELSGEGCPDVQILFHGEMVAEGSGSDVTLQIPDARLWSAEAPDLYQCRVSLTEQGKTVDEQEISFGIRMIEWSSEGLFVNGVNTLLKGGCIHHDNGILGARSFDKSEWRRIRRLKEAGFNAVRSAHNPACRAVLEACDALGMYVMDETWDMWYHGKNKQDYANYFRDNYEEDVRTMVAKDFNHPSVILYSIGNEVNEPAQKEGVEMAEKLVELCHGLDDTRPVTAGINLTLLYIASLFQGADATSKQAQGQDAGIEQKPQEMDSTKYNEMAMQNAQRMSMAAASDGADTVTAPVLDLLDIAGYNYASSRYPLEGEKHPDRIVVGSETFPHELAANWKMVEKYPYLVGDFMWTAWDYIGEVGIGAWSYESDSQSTWKPYPWLLADTGAFDILGNETAEAGMASVIWRHRDKPYIAAVPANHPGEQVIKSTWRGSNALPYWSYENCEGNETLVEVYSSGASVELFLNQESLGRKEVDENCRAIFDTAYKAGELRAVAYDRDGNAISEYSLHSAEGKKHIEIRPEQTEIRKGEILHLDIVIAGENGEIECNRDAVLRVSVEGGELLAFGSANPRTAERFADGSYGTYYGRSQAVVLAKEEQVTIEASCDEFDTVSLTLRE